MKSQMQRLVTKLIEKNEEIEKKKLHYKCGDCISRWNDELLIYIQQMTIDDEKEQEVEERR